MLYISLLAQAAAACLLVWIAIHDIRNYKILNIAVLAFLALYLPAQGFLGFPTIWSDLIAGGILFAMGFVLWLLRGLGAGDAKLMLPLGMHLGQIALLPFAILLLAVSVVLYAAMLGAHLAGAQRGIGGWLAGLRSGGRLPYGLVLAAAAVPVMVARIVWLA